MKTRWFQLVWFAGVPGLFCTGGWAGSAAGQAQDVPALLPAARDGQQHPKPLPSERGRPRPLLAASWPEPSGRERPRSDGQGIGLFVGDPSNRAVWASAGAPERSQPVTNLNDAVVFTMQESTTSERGVDLARQAGSDVMIRAWFKWAQAPPVERYRRIPELARRAGALFGGGITCSALYDQENGLSQEQVLDMATRGPDGRLVGAWGRGGIRHGSLSSPAYLDYLFRWCREQIDAGVDYLFMDEHTAALAANEGFDDHSLRDLRRYLLSECPQTRGWEPDDRRWSESYKIDLKDAQICSDGTMNSFDYRAYLAAHGFVEKPHAAENPLASLWHRFRSWRDDGAWKGLTDRIRAYADSKGRRVYLSANGLAKYVDLQVLGVWDQWLTRNGHIDLATEQLSYWHSLVSRGRELAERRVPVVLFHDWGMGNPPFPWLAVSPKEREIWMRTRGAEVYAAGGFFAFPVLGPFGCDAERDGTLTEMSRQAAFYQAHREIYVRGEYLGTRSLRSKAPDLSLAAWADNSSNAVALHVINRQMNDGRLVARKGLRIEAPLAAAPQSAEAVSPDWPGVKPVICRTRDGIVEVELPGVDAYVVALLRYPQPPDLSRLRDPVRILAVNRWERAAQNEFRVRPDGSVTDAAELNGFLQGRLHTHLRNPPEFLVQTRSEARLVVHVRALASTGARLEYRVDGKVAQVVELPDRDGQNDPGAAEYDQSWTFAIPIGSHRLTLDNQGADWCTIGWIEFQGEFR